MASSSGTSSVSTKFTQSSGSHQDLQLLMEQRKNKRKQSNRDSARRSRMRKQQHLDDLIAQVERLKRENSLILTNVNITTQQYLNVEAQNSILRARKTELAQSLKSLNHIINSTTTIGVYQSDCYISSAVNHHHHNNNNNNNHNSFMNPMHMAYLNQPMIVATADNMFEWSGHQSGMLLVTVQCFGKMDVGASVTGKKRREERWKEEKVKRETEVAEERKKKKKMQ
ncbi:hypothetical protein VNO78_28672 [Psophocarpus tetragonolobus]|uniref:BZIP domain-containing protein n=1 Tax=Psophocarpus tetragonolobus TaxID=3891 RepID=A0AAN9WYP0_PSOTE